MYNNQEAANMQEIASKAMDGAQAKIDQLNSMGSTARNQSTLQISDKEKEHRSARKFPFGAGDGTLTHGLFLGKEAL